MEEQCGTLAHAIYGACCLQYCLCTCQRSLIPMHLCNAVCAFRFRIRVRPSLARAQTACPSENVQFVLWENLGISVTNRPDRDRGICRKFLESLITGYN